MKKFALFLPLYGKTTHSIEPTLDQLENEINHERISVYLVYKNLEPFFYDEFLSKYKNIKIFKDENIEHKKHGKINFGLNIIKEDYVQIFDPDDSIFIEGLNKFVSELERTIASKNSPDLITTKIVSDKIVNDLESKKEFKNFVNKKILGVKNKKIKFVIWNANSVFKKSFLKKIYNEFGEIIFNGENLQLDDPIRTMSSFVLSNNFQTYNGGFYNYNGPSSSNDLARNSREHFMEEWTELKKLIKIASIGKEKIFENKHFFHNFVHFNFIYVRKHIKYNGKLYALFTIRKICKELKKNKYNNKFIRKFKFKILFDTNFLVTRKINFRKKVKNPNYLDESWISKRFQSYQENIKLNFPSLLKDIKKEKLNLIAHSGTALSILRNSKFIPWDDDMDFYVSFKDFALKFEKIEKLANKNGYDLVGFSNDKTIYDWNVYKFRRDLNEVQETQDGFTFDAVSFIDLFTLHPIISYSNYYKVMEKNTSLYVQHSMKLLFPFPNAIWFKTRPSFLKSIEGKMRFLRIGSKSKKKIKNRIEASLFVDGNWRYLRRNDKFHKRNEVIDMENIITKGFENFEIELNWNWKNEVIASYGKKCSFDFKKHIPHQPKWLNRKYALYQGYLLKLDKKTGHLNRVKDLNDSAYNLNLVNKIAKQNNWI